MFRKFCFLAVFWLPLLFTGCEQPVPPDIALESFGGEAWASLQSGNLSCLFPDEGGTDFFQVNATSDWKLSVSDNWCSATPSEGLAGKTIITIRVDSNNENDERSATVVLTCGDVTRSVRIIQKQKDAVLISPKSLEASSEGGTYTIEVQHNVGYSATVEAGAESWLKVLETKKMDKGQVIVTVLENTNPVSRTGRIVIESSLGKETVVVTQAGADVFVIAPSSVTMTATGGTFDLTVTATRSYQISSMPEWISEQSVDNKIHTMKVAANESTEERSGVIVFCDDRGVCLPVNVIQSGADVFEVSPTAVELDSDGGLFTVTVTATGSYHISSMPNWVTEESTSNHVYSFRVAANPTSEERSDVIVFCDDRGICLPVIVRQTGKEDFDWSVAFYHHSLFMRFTATWCGYCPRMIPVIQTIQRELPDKIELVNVHGSGSHYYVPSIMEPFDSHFHVSGFPSACVDGRRMTDYSTINAKSTVEEGEVTYSTVSTIGYLSSFDGRQLDIQLKLYLKKADKYKVTVLLLEDGVIGYQADNTDGAHQDYQHDRIARMAISDVLGDPFTTSEDNTIKNMRYSVTVPAEYVKDNLRILVWVQRAFGLQERLTDADYGDYYVDNCISGKAGCNLSPAVVTGAEGGNEEFVSGNKINW